VSSLHLSIECPEKLTLTSLGNNGLGKETILQLAKHKPSKIYLAARDDFKGQEAVKSIKDSIGQSTADIKHLPLDLASFKSIRSAAASVQSSTDRLDILICNAGVMALPSGRTEQGHEIQFGTNHVGHHYLTKLLLPTLKKTAALPSSDVRVVTISSVANDRAPPIETMLDTEKLSALGTWARYGASKAANILFAAELARRHPAITSVSVHPGVVKSDLWKASNENNMLIRFGLMLVGPLMFQSVQTGAHNQLWASAGAMKDEMQNGAYYTPVGKVESGNTGNKHAKDAEAGKALWEWTEAEIAKV
jgi:NAD(P)-dependent dehydrogenase (short-subunit alcohol dehydrogenase family)